MAPRGLGPQAGAGGGLPVAGLLGRGPGGRSAHSAERRRVHRHPAEPDPVRPRWTSARTCCGRPSPSRRGAPASDLRLFRVTGPNKGGGGLEAVDPGAACAETEPPEPVDSGGQACRPRAKCLAVSVCDVPPSFRLMCEGRIADVTVSPEPVWNVRSLAVVSFLLHPTVSLVRTGEEPRTASKRRPAYAGPCRRGSRRHACASPTPQPPGTTRRVAFIWGRRWPP